MDATDYLTEGFIKEQGFVNYSPNEGFYRPYCWRKGDVRLDMDPHKGFFVMRDLRDRWDSPYCKSPVLTEAKFLEALSFMSL